MPAEWQLERLEETDLWRAEAGRAPNTGQLEERQRSGHESVLVDTAVGGGKIGYENGGKDLTKLASPHLPKCKRLPRA